MDLPPDISSHARLNVCSRTSCACARSGMRLTQYEKDSSACSSKMSRNSCSFHRLRIAGESYDSRFWQTCGNFCRNFHSTPQYLNNRGVDNSNPETERFVNAASAVFYLTGISAIIVLHSPVAQW